MSNKLYLVTGAAGFLGGHVCRQLIARGDKVRAFALPGDKAIQYIPEGVEVVEGNLCSIDDVYNLDKNNSFDYSKAVREIGYKTRPYKETIKDEIAWLKENGHI